MLSEIRLHVTEETFFSLVAKRKSLHILTHLCPLIKHGELHANDANVTVKHILPDVTVGSKFDQKKMNLLYLN